MLFSTDLLQADAGSRRQSAASLLLAFLLSDHHSRLLNDVHYMLQRFPSDGSTMTPCVKAADRCFGRVSPHQITTMKRSARTRTSFITPAPFQRRARCPVWYVSTHRLIQSCLICCAIQDKTNRRHAFPSYVYPDSPERSPR